MQKDKIKQIDIFHSVKSDAINKLTPDILETSFDLLIESEILKDIPLFGIGFKSFSIYKKITESFFTRKILTFLFQIKDIPISQRESFIQKIESKNKTNKAGEKILITLNRLDDIGKAKIIGKLFKKTILGKITFNNFKRLAHIIEITYFDDLVKLKNVGLYLIDIDVKTNLYRSGLLNQYIKDNRESQEYINQLMDSNDTIPPSLEYKLNNYGKILIENGFD